MTTKDLDDIRYGRDVVARRELQQRREAANLTRSELADGVKATVDAVGLWERCERVPRTAHALLLGRLLRHLDAGAGQ